MSPTPDSSAISNAVHSFLEHCSLTTLESGTEIFDKDQVATQFAIIKNGLAGYYFKDHQRGSQKATDNWALMALYSHGDFINVGECLHQEINASIRTLSTCEIAFFDRNQWQTLDSSVLSSCILTIASYEQAHLLRQFSFKMSIKDRLLYTLWYIRNCTAMEEVPLTQKDLADLTRSDRSNISEAAKELEDEGVIEKGYGRYWIIEKPKLYKYLMSLRMGTSPATIQHNYPEDHSSE